MIIIYFYYDLSARITNDLLDLSTVELLRNIMSERLSIVVSLLEFFMARFHAIPLFFRGIYLK